MIMRVLNTIILFSAIITLASCGGMVGDSKNDAGGNNPANSNSKTLTAFSIVTPSSAGVIDETSKTVSITVPHGTDMTNLVADFSTTGEATTVNGVEQVNRVTANNFTNPVIYTITAENGTTAEYTVNVNTAQSRSKAITSFSINGVNALINESAKTIGLTLPNGTGLTALTAVFTTTGISVKIGSTVQVSGTTVNNFSANLIYTVTASDGSQQNYTVAVSSALSSAKAITAFSINGVSGAINESTKTIGLILPYDTDTSALTAFFTTTGASVEVGFFGTEQESGVTSNDFTNPVTYTVTAEDGSEAEYTVAVSVAAGNAKAFTAFSIDGVSGTINEPAKTITLTMPFETDITALVASFSITGSSVKIGSTVQASGGTENNFSGDVIYTVVAGDGSEQNYTVSVSVALNSARAFSAFSINSVNGTINETLMTIALTVPSYTDVTALAAVFTATGVSVKVGSDVQVSGTTQNDFTSPVVYTVTAENGLTQDYTVTVTRAPSNSKSIVEFSINGVYGTISQITKIITVRLPVGTDVTALVATFETTGASVMIDDTVQVSEVTANDFTDLMLTYTVVAENGTIKDYYVVIELVDVINHWARTSNSSYGSSTYYSVKAGNNGFIYAVGDFHQSGGYTFDLGNGVAIPGTDDYYSDMIVVKYDNLGNAQWAKTVSGGIEDSMLNAVTEDNAGNVYAAGYVQAAGTSDFGSGVSLTASGFRSVIVKYNSSGDALWVKTVPGGWYFAVTVDGNGNVFAAGMVSSNGTIDCGDGKQITGLSTDKSILLVKYNSAGQTQWARTFVSRSNTGHAYYHSLATDTEGNVYAAGEGEGSYDFGDGITAGSSGAILVKYNSSGAAQWVKTSESYCYVDEDGYQRLVPFNGKVCFNSISIDNNGNIFTAGYITQSACFGSNFIIWSSFGTQPVLVKYNSLGDVQWVKSITTAPDSSAFNSISIDNSGNIYAAGYIEGTSTFDFGNNVTAKGVNQYNSQYNWGQNSVLVKYSSSGVAQWAKTVVSAPGATQFECVSTDNNGHAYAVGYLNTSGSYNFGEYVTVYKRSSSSREHVIVKYKENY